MLHGVAMPVVFATVGMVDGKRKSKKTYRLMLVVVSINLRGLQEYCDACL